MPRQKPPRKTYKPKLTWTEELDTSDEEWKQLELKATYAGSIYFTIIRTRHKWWGANKHRYCYIELYKKTDTDMHDPLECGPYFENIRIFDPQRYKAEALHWAESYLFSPMRLLGLELDNLTNDKKDDQRR